MKFEMSNCIALETPQPDKAIRFYTEVLGLQPTQKTADFTVQKRSGEVLCNPAEQMPGADVGF